MRILTALLLVMLSVGPLTAGELSTAKPADVGLDPTLVDKALESAKSLVEKKEVAGAVVVIARKGKVVRFEAMGEREFGTSNAMSMDSIFRIYSMTKPITSVAVMMLVEQGKIDIDDPVARYLPEFKNRVVLAGNPNATVPANRDVTVRDLLRHTAGLTYGIFGNSPVDELYKKVGVLVPTDTSEQLVAKLGKLPLMFQPGTRWHYSVATDVCGRLVEVVSGMALDEFMSEKIFKPLDMNDSAFHVPDEKIDRFTAVHGVMNGKLTVTEKPGTSRFRKKPVFLSGGGGGISTARDYLRFCQMLLNGGELDGSRILKRATIAEMTRNQLSDEAMKEKNGGNAAVGDGFGLGFGVRVGHDNRAAGNFVGEFHWGGAASTQFWIAPRQELIVMVLEQFMPYRNNLQRSVQPLIYRAVTP